MSQEAVVNRKIQGTQSRSRLRTTIQIAMLSAISAVLMMFEFPLPFLAPPFVQMDFSEIPVIVGTFAMGPLAGVIIEFLKNLLHIVLHGTMTAGVGEFSNFLIGCAFAVPAGLLYRKKKTAKNALLGMSVGTMCMAAAGCLTNAFVMFPLYSKAMGIPMDSFIAMGKEIIPAVDNMLTFVLLCMEPFNLIKGALISGITMLSYKRLKVLLKGE